MKGKRSFWVRVKGFVVRCLVRLCPQGYAIVPTEATPEMLDIEFYGDLGSGVPDRHKYLRADEYYFSRREQALAWGAQLYREMVRAHNQTLCNNKQKARDE